MKISIALALLFAAVTAAQQTNDGGVESEDDFEYFNYRRENPLAPPNWDRLQGYTNNQCGGERQSPVAFLRELRCTDYVDYSLTFGNCRIGSMEFSVTTTGVSAKYDTTRCTPNSMIVPKVRGTFEVVQIDIHLSSEHRIAGYHYGAEMEVVHLDRSSSPTQYAMISMMINPHSPTDNLEFEELLTRWYAIYKAERDACRFNRRPEYEQEQQQRSDDRHSDSGGGSGSTENQGDFFDVYEFLPDDVAFYHYFGSFTTPPCAQGVWWNVSDKTINISPRQYKELVETILNFRRYPKCDIISVASESGSTSRPLQEKNGRRIDYYCPSSSRAVGS